MISKNEFLLNPNIFFFNNGSFGACPKIVFDKYQEWQRLLEYQPVEFFIKTLIPGLQKSRETLGSFINADPEDLLLTVNATYAVNTVIRSLDLKPQDEVIVTNHEYGACLNAWEYWQKEKGFKIKTIYIDLPLPEDDEIVEIFSKEITENTRVLFFSHISSQTAQILPAKALCKLAEQHLIFSVVDAAHAIGQLDLDFRELNPDFYFSNIHKWLYAPKGTAFLYVKKEHQKLIKPLISGWGLYKVNDMTTGNAFLDSNQYYGTNDLSSFLTIPEAIAFYQNNRIDLLKQQCHELVQYFIEQTLTITGLPNLYRNFSAFCMMGVVELPQKYSSKELKRLLYDQYQIEIPVIEWNDKLMIRISIQIFNTKEEVEYLLEVLRELYERRYF